MNTERVLDLPNEAATRRLGKKLAALARPGDVLALYGGLGSGKTTLARAFIRSLAGDHEDVPSPTFTLVQTYETDALTLWHFDLYRLASPADVYELAIEDAFADGVSLIEWPDRLGSLLPARRLDLTLETGSKPDGRRAILVSHGQWDDRIGDIV